LPVPPEEVAALRSRARAAGLETGPVAADLGIDLTDEAAISLPDFLRLQGRVTSLLGDETGRLSKRQLVTGSTELALAQLPTRGSLRDAMRTVARTYNVLHGGAFNMVEDRPDAVAFIIDDRDFPYAVNDREQVLFIMETTILFLHALLRLIVPSVAAGGWRGVELKRDAGPAAVPFSQHVATLFGAARYAILYDRIASSRIVTFPPPGSITLEAVTKEQVRLLEGGPDDRTMAGRVRLLIEDGAADQTDVAKALGMSVATLRRRLTEEGASFRALRNEALRDTALRLLEGDLPLAAVAERLGFSDVRSFGRAFKAWTGTTPNCARKDAQN
jgi:AraC-like DNA-binding protein